MVMITNIKIIFIRFYVTLFLFLIRDTFEIGVIFTVFCEAL
jgi:hypothetical protein